MAEVITDYKTGMQAEMAAFMSAAALSAYVEDAQNSLSQIKETVGMRTAAAVSAGALALSVGVAEANRLPLHTYGWLTENCKLTKLTVANIPKDKKVSSPRASINFKVEYRVVDSLASGKFSWVEKAGQKYCGIARRVTSDVYYKKPGARVTKPDHLTRTTGDWDDTAAVPSNPGAPGNQLKYRDSTVDFLLFTRRR